MPTKTPQQSKNKTHAKTGQAPKLRFSGFFGEWEEKKLVDIVEIDPKSHKLPDSFIYIDLESVEKGILKKEGRILLKSAPSRAQRLLQKSDILFQTVRPYQKNNLFFDRDGEYVASTGYAQLRNIDSAKYVYQLLHTNKFVNDVLVRCIGTSYPAISSKELGKIKINLPSLPEQQKIASFLGAVDEWIGSLRKQKESLEKYKKGMMQKIFNQQIRFPGFGEKWEEKKLGDIAKFLKGKGISKEDIVKDGENKCIRYGELYTEYNEIIKRVVSYTNTSVKGSVLSKKNDILVPTSDVTPRGLATASSLNEEGVILGGDILIIRSKEILNSFFSYYVRANKKGIMRLVSGVTVYHIYGSDLAKMKISIPSLQEQQKIADFLISVDELITLKEKQITQAENWKKGLMQGLFV